MQFAHVSSSVAIAREMAGDNLATLPNSLIFVGALITTMPLSIMGEKYGLRISYVFGTGMGLTGGTLCLLAMYFWSFPLLCFGLLLQGSQQATTSLVRFGVRSVVPARYMSKALSWVVAGAAIAAPVGPLIGANTIYMIPAHKYMGVYIIILCLIAAMTVVTSLLRFPPLPPKKATDEPDQARWPIIREFLRSKKFMIALIAGSVSYALMVLMMVSCSFLLRMAIPPLTPTRSGSGSVGHSGSWIFIRRPELHDHGAHPRNVRSFYIHWRWFHGFWIRGVRRGGRERRGCGFSRFHSPRPYSSLGLNQNLT